MSERDIKYEWDKDKDNPLQPYKSEQALIKDAQKKRLTPTEINKLKKPYYYTTEYARMMDEVHHKYKIIEEATKTETVKNKSKSKKSVTRVPAGLTEKEWQKLMDLCAKYGYEPYFPFPSFIRRDFKTLYKKAKRMLKYAKKNHIEDLIQ